MVETPIATRTSAKKRYPVKRRTLVAWAFLVLITLGACGRSTQEETSSSPSSAPESSEIYASENVDIGERSLFLHCRGSEGPTIVLEAGLTGDYRTWDRVMVEAPPELRLCAYDRANIGESDPAPTPRSAADVVDDLAALLEASGEDPPYVLVGFSMGGIFSQLYAMQHPDDVVGLVLVESNHADEARLFENHLTPKQIAEDRKFAKENPEGIDIYGSFAQVRDAPPLPQIPLVVVTATEGGDWPPGWDPEVFDRLRARQQADLAMLVPGGEQIFAEDSGHSAPTERPDVVVEAILQALQ